MICSICGKEFHEDRYGAFKVCSPECLNENTWRLMEELHKDCKVFTILNGFLYTADMMYPAKSPNELNAETLEVNAKMKDETKTFSIELLKGKKIPDNHRKILCDNAEIVDLFSSEDNSR